MFIKNSKTRGNLIKLYEALGKLKYDKRIEPMISNGLRPNLSTLKIATNVNIIFTNPMITVCHMGCIVSETETFENGRSII